MASIKNEVNYWLNTFQDVLVTDTQRCKANRIGLAWYILFLNTSTFWWQYLQFLFEVGYEEKLMDCIFYRYIHVYKQCLN